MSLEISTRESLQSQWDLSDNLADHLSVSKVALNYLERESGLVLPDTDRRWQLALARLTIAKEAYNGVQAIGEYAGMKSTFGNLLMGTDARVDVNPGDMAEDFFGHDHPNRQSDDVERFVPGKLAKSANPEAGTYHLSEVGNMRNQRPLGMLYEEGATLRINDETVIDTADSAFYLAMNFANNREVHQLNRNLQSRNPNQIVVGDGNIDFYKRAGSASVDYSAAPILPNLAIRREIGHLVDHTYTDPIVNNGVRLSADFTVDLLDQLNQTGLIQKASLSDVRVIQAMKSASQAYLYDRDAQKGSHSYVGETPIDKLVVAGVAAFVLPTVVKLNEIAEENFLENTGNMPTELEKAIAVRRLISKTAMTMAFTDVRSQAIDHAVGNDKALADELKTVEARLDQKVRLHTYADISALNYDVDKVYLNHSDQRVAKGEPKNGTRKFFRRSR